MKSGLQGVGENLEVGYFPNLSSITKDFMIHANNMIEDDEWRIRFYRCSDLKCRYFYILKEMLKIKNGSRDNFYTPTFLKGCLELLV